jgi:alpha/beta superfamily hydrolase
VEPIRLSTDDGVWLEGELRRPQDAPLGSAVLCHAHPRHGGSKDHPLLWAIRNELVSRGLVVLTFNFRGVLGSGGTYGGGRTELRDLAAGIARVEGEAAGPTLVCGWSFGAMVALREALSDPSVAALALVGLPVDDHELDVPSLPGAAELRTFLRPVLLVSGEGDQYTPRPGLGLVAARLPASELRIVSGTDHFFWRREVEVAAEIGSFAERVLR